MSQQNRTTLKGYFKTGTRPTQEQFADLVDSSLNLAHNGIFDEGGNLGLGHSNPSSRLSVKGNVTVSPNNDSAPGNGLFVHGNVGIGAGFTNPAAQLAVKGGVYIGNTETTDPGTNSLKVDGNIETGGNLSINGTLHAGDATTIAGNLTLADTKYVATDEVRARDSGGLKLYDASGAGGLMIHDSGNVSIGSGDDQTDKLHVEGSLRVTSDAWVGGNLDVYGRLLAKSLSLTGDISRTEFKGRTINGEPVGAFTIEIPDNKVVVGLRAMRHTDGTHGVYYTFALEYR